MQVKFNNPEYPEGMEFDIGGFLFPNGQIVVISEEDQALYMARHGISLEEALAANQFASVDGVSYVPVDDEEEGDE